jgi:hypothetical protein
MRERPRFYLSLATFAMGEDATLVWRIHDLAE